MDLDFALVSRGDFRRQDIEQDTRTNLHRFLPLHTFELITPADLLKWRSWVSLE